MKQVTKRFKRTFNRAQDKMERKGFRMAYVAIKSQYKYVASKIKDSALEDLPGIIQDVPTERLSIFLSNYYSMAAPLALMQYKFAMGKKFEGSDLQTKDSEDEFFMTTFEAELKRLINQNGGELIKTITNTSKEKMLAAVREILDDGRANGLGVDIIKQNLIKKFGTDFVGNAAARARAIARTEMIKASNQAQQFAMQSTKLQYRKFWSGSHLPNERDSHIEAEQDSIQRGGLQPNELHSNGLKYVGDPNGPAEEVINCRCTELYEVI